MQIDLKTFKQLKNIYSEGNNITFNIVTSIQEKPIGIKIINNFQSQSKAYQSEISSEFFKIILNRPLPVKNEHENEQDDEIVLMSNHISINLTSRSSFRI